METEVLIETLSQKGLGVGYVNNTKVEIPHALSGDTVLASLTKKRKGKIKGRLESITIPSKARISPVCPHSRICGGCLWQEMDYSSQLKEKEKRVIEAFDTLFYEQSTLLFPIIPSQENFYYRNKMEFSFSENKKGDKYLGLMIASASRYVFNLEDCCLASKWFAKVLQNVRKWWEASSISAYHPPANAGTLRNLTIREGKNTSEKMVILTISGLEPLTDTQLQSFVEAVKQIVENPSIYLRIQTCIKGTPTTFEEIVLSGASHIMEKINLSYPTKRSLSFKISPSSFFQPNTKQAEKLYSTALEIAGEANIVYDLYCGTGTLGMAFSNLAEQVVGIELNADAVKDAQENLILNNIQNVTLHQGDVGKVLTNLFTKDFIYPDLVIVDPPRAGLDPLALHHLKMLKPKKILYISCNPYTQAENVKELLADYKLTKVQPLDQFAHTPHIENIALLERT